MAKDFPPTKVMTGKVRFSYANVFTAQAVNGSTDLKYSCSLIIPKTDTATVAAVQKAIAAATADGTKNKWGGKTPSVAAFPKMNPLRDGDVAKPDNPEYAGCWFLGCNSKTKPGILMVLNGQKIPVTSEDEFYSGCYGRAVVNFFPFDAKGNKGIGVGLNNLLKTDDGERLGGKDSAENDFADVEDADSLD